MRYNITVLNVSQEQPLSPPITAAAFPLCTATESFWRSDDVAKIFPVC